jgi:hypothetical protein
MYGVWRGRGAYLIVPWISAWPLYLSGSFCIDTKRLITKDGVVRSRVNTFSAGSQADKSDDVVNAIRGMMKMKKKKLHHYIIPATSGCLDDL